MEKYRCVFREYKSFLYLVANNPNDFIMEFKSVIYNYPCIESTIEIRQMYL